MRIWLAAVLALSALPGCSGGASVFIVSSPELKEAAAEEAKAVAALGADWEKTKGLLRSLDEQARDDLRLIAGEVRLMSGEADASRYVRQKQNVTGTAFDVEAFLVETWRRADETPTQLLEDAKKVVALLNPAERKQRIVESWRRVVGAPNATPPEPLSVTNPANLLDLKELDETIADTETSLRDGKGLSADQLRWLRFLRFMGGMSSADGITPEDLVLREIGVLDEYIGVEEGNWAEVDLRLAIVAKMAVAHATYMENDIETVKWEKLAKAFGNVADAASSLKK